LPLLALVIVEIPSKRRDYGDHDAEELRGIPPADCLIHFARLRVDSLPISFCYVAQFLFYTLRL
jgi:hypothetical protein